MPRASQAARSILSSPTPYLATARSPGAAASTSADTGSTPTIRPSQSARRSFMAAASRMPPVSLRLYSMPAARKRSKSVGSVLPKERGVTSTFINNSLLRTEAENFGGRARGARRFCPSLASGRRIVKMRRPPSRILSGRRAFFCRRIAGAALLCQGGMAGLFSVCGGPVAAGMGRKGEGVGRKEVFLWQKWAICL